MDFFFKKKQSFTTQCRENYVISCTLLLLVNPNSQRRDETAASY